MMTKKDLEQIRTLYEAGQFIEDVKINANVEDKKQIRSKRGVYRKYIQEYIPLFFYALHRYGIGSKVKIKANLGNENYDGIVLNSDDSELEKVEITYPIKGEEEFKDSIQLNKRGFTDVDVYGLDQINDIITAIIKKANDKAVKDYSRETLVIVVNPFPYFSLDDPEDIFKLNNLVEDLSKIEYIVKRVVLIALPYRSNVFNSYGNMWIVKEV